MMILVRQFKEPFSDEDVAIRRDNYVRRAVKGVVTGTGHTGLGERYQDLAVLVQLENLEALPIFNRLVDEPNISVLGNAHAMWRHEHSAAEILQQLSRGIKFENWIQCTAGPGSGATSIGDPNVPGLAVDIDRASRSQFSAGGSCAPRSRGRYGL